jgi:hypothetical protein
MPVTVKTVPAPPVIAEIRMGCEVAPEDKVLVVPAAKGEHLVLEFLSNNTLMGTVCVSAVTLSDFATALKTFAAQKFADKT